MFIQDCIYFYYMHTILLFKCLLVLYWVHNTVLGWINFSRIPFVFCISLFKYRSRWGMVGDIFVDHQWGWCVRSPIYSADNLKRYASYGIGLSIVLDQVVSYTTAIGTAIMIDLGKMDGEEKVQQMVMMFTSPIGVHALFVFWRGTYI